MKAGGQAPSASANPHAVIGLIERREQIALAVIVLCLAVGVGFDLSDQPLYEMYKGWLVALLGLAFLFAAVPAVLRCASHGFKSVWAVCGASIVLLVVTLVVFYTAYFWIVGPQAPSLSADTARLASDKVLNFPPIIAAVWAAGLGWYVHFQASAKNQRTSSSFHLVMQTRTSKEFLDRASRASIAYPYGTNAPEGDAPYIASCKQAEIERRAAARKDGEIEPALLAELNKARDVDAMKYLLNFYEFMAVGVEAKDLEETILYETLGVTVTSIYRRGEVFVKHVRGPDPNPQQLAFDALERLVKRWEGWLNRDIKALP